MEVESTEADVLLSVLDGVLLLSAVSVTVFGVVVTVVPAEKRVLVSTGPDSTVEVVPIVSVCEILAVSVEEVPLEELDREPLLGSRFVVPSELVEVS